MTIEFALFFCVLLWLSKGAAERKDEKIYVDHLLWSSDFVFVSGSPSFDDVFDKRLRLFVLSDVVKCLRLEMLEIFELLMRRAECSAMRKLINHATSDLVGRGMFRSCLVAREGRGSFFCIHFDWANIERRYWKRISIPPRRTLDSNVPICSPSANRFAIGRR